MKQLLLLLGLILTLENPIFAQIYSKEEWTLGTGLSFASSVQTFDDAYPKEQKSNHFSITPTANYFFTPLWRLSLAPTYKNSVSKVIYSQEPNYENNSVERSNTYGLGVGVAYLKPIFKDKLSLVLSDQIYYDLNERNRREFYKDPSTSGRVTTNSSHINTVANVLGLGLNYRFAKQWGVETNLLNVQFLSETYVGKNNDSYYIPDHSEKKNSFQFNSFLENFNLTFFYILPTPKK